MKSVFIDGLSGTTGQKIQGLIKPFAEAGKLRLMTIKDRRNDAERMQAFKEADLSVLCVPDDVAKATAKALDGSGVRLLDASSAHRVSNGWVFGFPELCEGQADAIAEAQFVSNPGCYATAAISILRPLTDAGIISPDMTVTLTGYSGYTGGGAKLIDLHENSGADFTLANVFGAYSLERPHKHVPEIQKYGGLAVPPVFLPHVLNVPRGIMVTLVLRDVEPEAIQSVFEKAYAGAGSKVRVMPLDMASSRLNFERFAGLNAKGHDDTPQDDLEIHVKGWQRGDIKQVTVHAMLDNLGKGAGTQALQNIRLMLNI